MAYIRTIPPEEAEGTLKEIYDKELSSQGFIANGTVTFSLHPDVFLAWQNLLKAIHSKMRLRRFELVTLATASALHCTYCLLAHGAVLRQQVFDADQLEAIVKDYHNAGLSPQEVALMEFAEKVALHAHAVQKEDIDTLRAHGLSDEEILDVTFTASARIFLSKILDAMGTEADMKYLDLEPNVRKAMQKGRPFAEEEICPVCFGTHIVKKIRTEDGREEYYCEACAKGGLLKPKNKYSEAQKLLILEHYERYSPEAIHQTFGVRPATLARWEKAKKKHSKKVNASLPKRSDAR
jgi:uncharacterized peroxidase-related enzyme